MQHWNLTPKLRWYTGKRKKGEWKNRIVWTGLWEEEIKFSGFLLFLSASSEFLLFHYSFSLSSLLSTVLPSLSFSSYLTLAFSHLKCLWSAAMLANVTWQGGGVPSNFFPFFIFYFLFSRTLAHPILTTPTPSKTPLRLCALCKWMPDWCNGQWGGWGKGRRRAEGDKDEQNQ